MAAVATRLGQRRPGALGQDGGQRDQALGASGIAQFGLGKFGHGPGIVVRRGEHAVSLVNLLALSGLFRSRIPEELQNEKMWIKIAL